jgi:hypothetical protein
VLARLLAAPFAFDHIRYQAGARRGLREVLDWLQSLPGDTWQDRWIASGAEHQTDWRSLPAQGTAGVGSQSIAIRTKAENQCSVGLTLLICADVIRPSMAWLLVTPAPKNLAAAMARTRDPAAFAELAAACEVLATGQATRYIALARIAMIIPCALADLSVKTAARLERQVVELRNQPKAGRRADCMPSHADDNALDRGPRRRAGP